MDSRIRGELKANKVIKQRKNCRACGRIFYASTRKKFCSRTCISKKQKRNCVHCGLEFIVSKNSKQVVCTKQCPALYITYPCTICNKKVTRPRCFGQGKYCSDQCQTIGLMESNDLITKPGLPVPITRHEKRRAGIIKSGDSINKIDVYEFYNWVCIICNKKIDKRLRWPDKMSASLEHVIPLAAGGTHTWDNVAPAHLLCNTTKADTIDEDVLCRYNSLKTLKKLYT